jgi:hypothetical protein
MYFYVEQVTLDGTIIYFNVNVSRIEIRSRRITDMLTFLFSNKPLGFTGERKAVMNFLVGKKNKSKFQYHQMAARCASHYGERLLWRTYKGN